MLKETFHISDTNPVWDVLTPGEKMFVEQNLQLIDFDRNQLIHKEGDTPQCAMMLIKGKVRIYKEGIGQRLQIIRMLKPFDLFSYRAILGDDTYNSCASALEPCTIGALPREAFMQIVKQNNQFCFRVMENMARDLAISELQTVNLTQKHIRGRLAEALINLKEQYGLDDDGVTISLYMCREDMANLSNMTTANAIRTLSQFAEEGLIGIDGRKIRILNEAELRHISRLG